jgi:pimeloyl-ACP methyl ester carboxylesterase
VLEHRPSHIEFLREGTGSDAIVAVDFYGARPDADFRDLVDLDGGEGLGTALQLTPFGLGGEDIPESPELWVREYARQLKALGHMRFTVVGYCVGAPLAEALATESGRQGVVVSSLVLLNPARATHGEVFGAADEIVRALQAEQGRVRNGMTGLDAASSVQEAIDRVTRLVNIQLDPAFASVFAARYRAWLMFLWVSSCLDFKSFEGETHVILSVESQLPEHMAAHASIHRVSVTQPDLLRSTAVLRVILDAANRGRDI